MPNTYQSPYSFTSFPIFSGESTITLYSNTVTFPTYTGQSNLSSFGNQLSSTYLTDNNILIKPYEQKYPKPYGIPLGLGAVSYQTPYNSPEIVLGNDKQTDPNPVGFTYPTRADIIKNIGNLPPGFIFKSALRNAAVGAAAGLGTAMTHQLTGPLISTAFNAVPGITPDPGSGNMDQPYSVMPFTRKKNIENWVLTKYKDFRSFKGYTFSVDNVRLDGASAAARGAFNGDVKNAIIAGIYAAAAATPGGAYKVFNLESTYGFGNHGDPAALRRDFTARSQVATQWFPTLTKIDGKTVPGNWIPTINPVELGTEFRGDKINVIDYGKRTLKEVYRWKPKLFSFNNEKWNNALDVVQQSELTKDFIKFYFTGPKLQNGLDEEDDIIVFRAIIDSFSDTHTPSWNAVQMVGRADPNYTYQGYSRDLSLSFKVHATSRDEMKPIYRKLNALASYTVPEYGSNTIAMKSPWLRMTIGDLLVQQPVLITSLGYTFAGSDTIWEINIEDDPTMMQVPHSVDVQMGLHLITDYLPEHKGRLYTLAKQFKADGVPIEGSDNWLSDFGSNAPNEQLEQWLASVTSGKVKEKGEVPKKE
jgi:hypothetical protein